MFSVPDGRAANQPLAAHDFQAADRCVVARGAGQLGRDRLAGQRRLLDGLGRQFLKPRLLLGRRRRVDARVVGSAEFRRQFAIVLARVLAGARGDLGRQQVHDRAVLVGRPHGAVAPQEARPGTLLAAEAARAVEQARRKPLEADRHLAQPAAELVHHPVDHAAADQRLADRGLRRPSGTMREQVADGDGQVVIGIHQPRRRRDDAVPVRVGVVGEGDAVLVLEADEPGHRVGTGTVHADLAVVIDGHEREGRIDLRIHHVDVQTVDLVDRLPVVHGRAAERVDAQLEAGGADGVHVDDVPQVVDVGQDEVFLVRGRRLDGRRKRHASARRHCRLAAARWPGSGSTSSRRCRPGRRWSGCT